MPELSRRVGFWGASAIMVGVIIGGGIFRQPASIAGYLGNPTIVLIFWAVGGLLALFGAMTYSELACMYPQSGGVYIFLREGFGRAVAFVFGWTYMLITKPFGAAGICVMFAESLNQLLDVRWDLKVVTTIALVVLTIINSFGVDIGAGLAKAVTSAKFLALFAIVILVAALRKGSVAHFESSPAPVSLLAAIAPVMAAVMWTYDGWSDVGAIAGEVKDPRRLMPRVFIIGTAAVTALYLLVNAAYIALVPLEEMRKIESVAPLVMDRLIGPIGATAVVAIIMISTLGSTHGSVLTGARVTYAQACDGLLFRSLAYVHPRYRTPLVALWVQLVLSCAAVWYQSDQGQPQQLFTKLAESFVFTMWIFYGLAAATIFILRAKYPNADRPYRCWGYPVVPAVFIVSALAMTVLSIRADLLDESSGGLMTLPWLAVLVAGTPVYFIWRRFVGETPSPSAAPATPKACLKCGHSLEGLKVDRCPECGEPVGPLER
jgi:basic amino acid/polyamine antiporter, APA family